MLKIQEDASRPDEQPEAQVAGRGECNRISRAARGEEIDGSRFERFELNGYYFEIDWDEIDPPGEEDEPGIPHEEVMREVRELLQRADGTR